MISIKPFKAVRPTRSKSSVVPTKPFYTYKKNILEAILEGNPYSFLHVINPEFKSEKKTPANSDERFLHVKEKYEEFNAKGYFIKEEVPSFYLYRQSSESSSFTGIIAGASVENYNNGLIKVHEQTLSQREETFKRYLDICEFNAEPVLLTYQPDRSISYIIKETVKKRPEYEFTTIDGLTHELWVISDDNTISHLTASFESIPCVYIADGHHRSSSSALLHGDRNSESTSHFLAYFIEESEMEIHAYNRALTSINDLSIDELVNQMKEDFDFVDAEQQAKDHLIKMYDGEKWLGFVPKQGTFDPTHPVGVLDADILSKLVFEKILGITDLKTDNRVLFVEGTKGRQGLVDIVDSETAVVSFALQCVSIDQLKNVADTGNIMPPKCTWIEPKMRSGLTIYEF